VKFSEFENLGCYSEYEIDDECEFETDDECEYEICTVNGYILNLFCIDKISLCIDCPHVFIFNELDIYLHQISKLQYPSSNCNFLFYNALWSAFSTSGKWKPRMIGGAIYKA
jgi:hypothetical protein